MKVYDISQEVFSCKVFPGDPAPQMKRIMSKENGDVCNLTEFSMCAHNGTHIDAPFHFIGDGKRVDEVALDAFVGMAYVTFHKGDVSSKDAERIISEAQTYKCGAEKRILIGGTATVTEEAAEVFAKNSVLLLGNESQTVGPEDAPARVHNILLGAGVVLLEGIKLGGVPAGKYLLSAAPLNLGGCDGAPCRAVLVEV